MNVTLIFPAIAESGFNKAQAVRKYDWINHGLCSLSACAKAKGHNVSLIDLRNLSGWDDFRKAVRDQKPDLVGITMMSVDFNPAMEAARIVKEIDSNIRVVMGGPHPSIAPDEVAKSPAVDHIVIGEGENVFIRLLDDLSAGKNAARIIHGDHPDLNRLPFADRGLFQCQETPIDSFLEKPFVTVIAGRGCIYNCSFCQPAERMVFGKTVRRRSVANIIRELDLLRERCRFESFMFHDDCLTEDRDWVMSFCEEYRRRKFRKPFVCQSRADIICKNEDMVRLMRKAGLAMFLIGFESGNQRILNFLRKGTTVKQNIMANRICHKYGIRVWANYMLGMPTETKEEVMDTVRMIKQIKPYRPSPAFFTPHPGSDLFDYCVKHDLSLIKSHNDYSRAPTAPKIKGIDHAFLLQALDDSQKRSLSVRIRRRTDFIIERRIKHAFNKLMKSMRPG